MPLSPSDLIRKAAAHLREVGLKKGSFSHIDRKSFDKDGSPVCGVGALKWAATGSPKFEVRYQGTREFIIAWNCMNKAAAQEDPTIPLDSDSFMTYNDDEDTTKDDVLYVMEQAAILAENS